jgi:spore coat protein CotF
MTNGSMIYTDKEVLSDALTAEKGATTLYTTFANECVHPEVRNTLLQLLKDEQDIQFDVFNAMHARGFYPTPAAEQKKIDEARQTFSSQANC